MKIAFIGTLFFDESFNKDIISNTYLKCIDALFKSGKKYFLPNHEVEFLLITNNDNVHLDHLEYVKLIKVDYYIHNNWHAYLMKILGIEFVPKEYDYIFSLDVDQLFVNEVKDEDVLLNDFSIMEHWAKPTYASILEGVTEFVTVDFDAKEYYWVLGSFFGGKSEKMYELFEMSKKIHDELFNKKIREDCNFYSKYPEELFIGKYVYENKIDFKNLIGSLGFDEDITKEFFLGDFEQLANKYVKNDKDETLFKDIKNIKLIHNTKMNLEAFDAFAKYYI
jgi:hypothetical protein